MPKYGLCAVRHHDSNVSRLPHNNDPAVKPKPKPGPHLNVLKSSVL